MTIKDSPDDWPEGVRADTELRLGKKPCSRGHTPPWRYKDYRCVQCARSPEDRTANRLRNRANVRQIVLNSARSRAAAARVPFRLTLETLPAIPVVCPVLGILLQHTLDAPADNSPSLDRTVPALGYVPGNVVWMSWRANTLKSNGTLEEFAALVQYLTRLATEGSNLQHSD
jgi:hypothetical protein